MGVLVRAQDGELLDELIYRHYGQQSAGLVESILSQPENSFLKEPSAPLALDMSMQIMMPDSEELDDEDESLITSYSTNFWD
ncbi:tail protein X [uncultured Cohaesibacter sp.]|uniref:tail protein X n=1 Tax=uncultured Cohaesibacter sp. TaxID=1002546 RepID=UPI002AABF87D|nr:tail protein X [uncultured Cohaesibacter sp.]